MKNLFKMITEKSIRKAMLMLANLVIIFISISALKYDPTWSTFSLVFCILVGFTTAIGYILIKDKSI